MDQLDDRDRQAYAELQEKLIEQSSKKKQVWRSTGMQRHLSNFPQRNLCHILTGSFATPGT